MDNPIIAGISLVIFAIPAYYFLVSTAGLKRGIIVIFALQIFALGIETYALATGLPYGQFTYSDSLGYKLFGLTPWSVGLSWSMILIGATAIVHTFLKIKVLTIPAIIATLLAADLVLDPGAVALGYWTYSTGQAPYFYNVPWTNFLGWIVSGAIGSSLLLLLLPKKIPAKAALSLLCIVLFWTGIDIYKGLYLPAIIGILLSTVCIFTVWGSESSKE